MKKWLLIFLLLQNTSALVAQQPIFHLDSLPTNGILLRTGWKFHAGDNPKWAKPDLDDSKWDSIEPTKAIYYLPQIRKSPVGWLRIHLRVDSALLNKPLAFQIKQTAASEVFLNGRLLHCYGRVSTQPEKVKAFDPVQEPSGLLFNQTNQVLAIRFSVQEGLPYFNYNSAFFFFRFRIREIKNTDRFNENRLLLEHMNFIYGGLFLLLGIIHLVFFFSFPKQKANLYFSLFALTASAANLLYVYTLRNNDVTVKVYAAVIDYMLLFSFFGLFLLLAIYQLFNKPKRFLFWFIVFYSLVGFLISIYTYEWGLIFGYLIPYFSAILISFQIALSAYLNEKKAVGLLVFGIGNYCILYLLFLLTLFGKLPSPSIGYGFVLNDLFYQSSMICISLSFSIYLSKEFAFTGKDLEKQLAEVQQLSQEKESILLQQNAELQAALLQGQTTERKRVAADLHDNLGTSLSALRWNLEAINPKNLNTNEQEAYRNLHSMIDKAYNEVRLLSHNLLPEDLEKQGLRVTLQSFVRKINQNTSLKFTLSFSDNFPRLSPKTEFELYSICLELINNILKHAQATQASIKFEVESEKVRLILSDNGKGLSENGSTGKGLRNIAERVKSLGGTWEVKSEDGLGVVNEIVVNISY
jgi:signal transduction histidine kinase